MKFWVFDDDRGGLLLSTHSKEDARRICAAVNACASLTTESLEFAAAENLNLEFQNRVKNLQAEADRLRAENERLRDALSCVENLQSQTRVVLDQTDAESLWNTVQEIFNIARAALSETTQPKPAPVQPEPINARLFEAMRNLVAHLREKYPWCLSEPLKSLMIEAEASLHDPNGWEPRGIIQLVNPSGPFTSDDVQKFMTEAEYTRQIGRLQSAIRHFVGASRFAMRLLSQNEGDALAQACVSELAQAINRVTTYGPGPMIQERPRPEETDLEDENQPVTA